MSVSADKLSLWLDVLERLKITLEWDVSEADRPNTAPLAKTIREIREAYRDAVAEETRSA
jgi:hypothetical protein